MGRSRSAIPKTADRIMSTAAPEHALLAVGEVVWARVQESGWWPGVVARRTHTRLRRFVSYRINYCGLEHQ